MQKSQPSRFATRPNCTARPCLDNSKRAAFLSLTFWSFPGFPMAGLGWESCILPVPCIIRLPPTPPTSLEPAVVLLWLPSRRKMFLCGPLSEQLVRSSDSYQGTQISLEPIPLSFQSLCRHTDPSPDTLTLPWGLTTLQTEPDPSKLFWFRSQMFFQCLLLRSWLPIEGDIGGGTPTFRSHGLGGGSGSLGHDLEKP